MRDLRRRVGVDLVEGVEREVDGGFDVELSAAERRVLTSRALAQVLFDPLFGGTLVRGARQAEPVASGPQALEEKRSFF
jgi:hypothetical protein